MTYLAIYHNGSPITSSFIRNPVNQRLNTQDQCYEGSNTTCWETHWRNIRGRNVCVLDRRNVDTHSAASVVWRGIFRSAALGDAVRE